MSEPWRHHLENRDEGRSQSVSDYQLVAAELVHGRPAQASHSRDDDSLSRMARWKWGTVLLGAVTAKVGFIAGNAVLVAMVAIVSCVVLTAAVILTLHGLFTSLARPDRGGFLPTAAGIAEAGVCLLLVFFCAALLILRVAMLVAR